VSMFTSRTSRLLSVCVFLFTTLMSIEAIFGQSDFESLVSDLKDGSHGDIEFALFEIAKLGPDASSAVDAICCHLDSTSFSVRSLASEALVAIGPKSVPALREILKSESTPTCAAVLQTLGRLNSITLEELEEFANNKDSRIKMAMAVAIRHGQFKRADDAVGKLLVELLEDQDPTVVVQACLALQKKRISSSIVVPELIKALARKRLQKELLHTLMRYGTDANAALPYLLANFNESDFDDLFSNGLDKELERIGPPKPADIDKLFSLIEKRDFERIRKAVDVIGRMQLAGSDHADRLAELAIQYADEAILFREKYHSASSEEDREQFDVYYELFWAAKHCAVASWNVSHDAKRFVSLIERIQIGCEGEVYFTNDLQNGNPWRSFSATDATEISHWLESDNEILNKQAFDAIRYIGVNALPHLDRLIELLAEEEFRNQAIDALASIGPSAADQALPVLVAMVNEDKIGAKELAIYVSQVKVSSLESDVILKRGLLMSQSSNECAKALCMSAGKSDEGEVFRLVIEAAEGRGKVDGFYGDSRRIAKDNAIRELAVLKNVPESALSFVLANLNYSGGKIPNPAAYRLLGNIGPPAKDSVGEIRLRLDYRDFEVRLNTAVALFQIIDDRETLEQLLVDEMKHPDNRYWARLKSIQAIVDLEDKGLSFRKFIWENEQYFIDQCVAEYCDVLKTIGDARSLASLRRIAKSKDWVGQHAASNILRLIEKKNLEAGK